MQIALYLKIVSHVPKNSFTLIIIVGMVHGIKFLYAFVYCEAAPAAFVVAQINCT